MLSLKQKQSGFTIVELLIVIVIIGILAGLVITTFIGIQARARDSERQTDINSVQKQVEAFYANNGYYPTRANLNDASWRTTNKVTLDNKALFDPKQATNGTVGADYPLGPTVSASQYSYAPTLSGSACTGTSQCDGYTLTAQSEVDATKTFVQKNQ